MASKAKSKLGAPDILKRFQLLPLFYRYNIFLSTRAVQNSVTTHRLPMISPKTSCRAERFRESEFRRWQKEQLKRLVYTLLWFSLLGFVITVFSSTLHSRCSYRNLMHCLSGWIHERSFSKVWISERLFLKLLSFKLAVYHMDFT